MPRPGPIKKNHLHHLIHAIEQEQTAAISTIATIASITAPTAPSIASAPTAPVPSAIASTYSCSSSNSNNSKRKRDQLSSPEIGNDGDHHSSVFAPPNQKKQQRMIVNPFRPVRLNFDLIKPMIDEIHFIYNQTTSFLTRIIAIRLIRNRLKPDLLSTDVSFDQTMTEMIHERIYFHLTRPSRTRINQMSVTIQLEASPHGCFFTSQSNIVPFDFFRALKTHVHAALQLVRDDCRSHTTENVNLWDLEFHLWTYENHFMEHGPAYSSRYDPRQAQIVHQ
jgi:hypothetical protein